MKQANLISVILMVFAFSNALGIKCNSCVPNRNDPTKVCSTAGELVEIDCATLNNTHPVTNATITYDSCITAKITGTLFNNPLTTYVMECAVKNPNSSVVNCSMHEAGLCAEARAMVASIAGVKINSCTAHCCTTDKCNVRDLGVVPSTAAQTTGATTTTKSGANKAQPPLFGLVLVFLSMMLKQRGYFF